jgi:hypothetical protein
LQGLVGSVFYGDYPAGEIYVNDLFHFVTILVEVVSLK